MNKQISKLQTALIETGKEVEAMKETPGEAQIHICFLCFSLAIKENNMKDMHRYGRKLAALVLKFMIEKL
jgi:hypothetical protein